MQTSPMNYAHDGYGLRQATRSDVAALEGIRHAVTENPLPPGLITADDYIREIDVTGRCWLIEVDRLGIVAFAIGNARNETTPGRCSSRPASRAGVTVAAAGLHSSRTTNATTDQGGSDLLGRFGGRRVRLTSTLTGIGRWGIDSAARNTRVDSEPRPTRQLL